MKPSLNVSNHPGCLRDCGLAVAEQEGRYVTYHLSDDRVGELMTLAETLLADVARGCTKVLDIMSPWSRNLC
jgi:DNA-binding transcriptional ArsR family regulator